MTIARSRGQSMGAWWVWAWMWVVLSNGGLWRGGSRLRSRVEWRMRRADGIHSMHTVGNRLRVSECFTGNIEWEYHIRWPCLRDRIVLGTIRFVLFLCNSQRAMQTNTQNVANRDTMRQDRMQTYHVKVRWETLTSDLLIVNKVRGIGTETDRTR